MALRRFSKKRKIFKNDASNRESVLKKSPHDLVAWLQEEIDSFHDQYFKGFKGRTLSTQAYIVQKDGSIVTMPATASDIKEMAADPTPSILLGGRVLCYVLSSQCGIAPKYAPVEDNQERDFVLTNTRHLYGVRYVSIREIIKDKTGSVSLHRATDVLERLTRYEPLWAGP